MDLDTALEQAECALVGEPDADRTVFLARLRRHWPDLVDGLGEVYGTRADQAIASSLQTCLRRFAERPAELRLLDLERHVAPDWLQQPSMLGYAAYADRFAGTLRGVGEHVDYLRELGVTYLHLMPLLQPRPGEDDGGYAVMDYRTVRPDLGTLDDLQALATTLRRSGISLVLDLVLNHVAAEHEWAARARAGEQRYRDYFLLFEDRTLPDAYEASLPEVFPDLAPGSFTWDDDAAAWVWTTFNSWQWDLDWSNPAVFAEFADLVCWLANLGVEVLRLDAIAFLWKRLGTDCQNQSEVHALTRALRALARIAAPALAFKAEAIVGPSQLPAYLGDGRLSDMAYHNSLMVQVWSALATGDARLMTAALQRFPPTPTTTTWATYLRGHDDIGWAVDDEDASAVGWQGAAHRAFLLRWYAGAAPGSTAQGLVFQEERTSGTAASLAGSTDRLLLGHLLLMGFGGLPVLWSGDELGLTNDEQWADEPGHAGDNRWVHRPRLPWARAARRHQPGNDEHRVFQALRHAAAVRAGLPAMHASVRPEVLGSPNPAVQVIRRAGRGQSVVTVANLSGAEQRTPWQGQAHDALSGTDRFGPELVLTPYAVLWLLF